MQRDFWTKCFHDLTKMISRQAQILQLIWQNFNFGCGSAQALYEIHDAPKSPLIIGWLRALLWTLADVCSIDLGLISASGFHPLVIFSCTWAAQF